MMEDIRQRGFTIIELMVAMAISGMLMAVVAMAYTGQSRSNNAIQDVTSLQQDLRSALQLMAREIRMAGYNPTGKAPAAGIVSIENAAKEPELHFKMDTDGDGTIATGEEVSFGINSNGSLGRETGGTGGLQPIAENINRLIFEYNLDDGTWTQAPTDLTKIRAVKIIIMGHSARETSGVVDNSTFTPPLTTASPPDWTPANPGKFHWRMMSLIVQCRNLQI